MPKAVRTAEQIRDELQTRMAKIAADVPGALHVRIKLPEPHPPDASGRIRPQLEHSVRASVRCVTGYRAAFHLWPHVVEQTVE
jgi:hypothetical protein